MSKRPLSSLSLAPSTLSALSREGYETVQDVFSSTPEQLSRDLKIPLSSSRAIFTASQSQRQMPFTQTAAAMIDGFNKKYRTLCTPIDKLLSGGLRKGSVLEISGPPGTAKEAVAMNVTASFLEADEGVLFVDMQNMVSLAKLREHLHQNPAVHSRRIDLIQYFRLHTLPELLVFLHRLPSLLAANPKTGLLVLNSIWFPFQSPTGTSYSARNALLDRLKQALSKVCASTGICVVTTTQLATKLVHADGSPANFDTGSRAIMMPQLGNTYLPNGKSCRVIIVPQTRKSGVVRLLPPAHIPGQDRQPLQEEPYEMIEGVMHST